MAVEPEPLETRRHPEYQYLDALSDVMANGRDRAKHYKEGREAIRCKVGVVHHYDLQREGFPALTTKDLFWRGVREEAKWFIEGETNIKPLVDKGINIWTGDAYRQYERAAREGRAENLSVEEYVDAIKTNQDFATAWGDLGPVYGRQWRRWQAPDGTEVDQLQQLVELLRNPIDRYRKSNVVTAWNPGENRQMALPACHMIFQTDVDEETNELTLILNQRSADMVLGVPFNIASYALMTHILAEVSGLKAGGFVHFMANYHIYHAHFDAVAEQLTRTPYPFPKLQLQPDLKELADFRPADAKLVDYQHHPRISAPMIAAGGIIDDPVELMRE